MICKQSITEHRWLGEKEKKRPRKSEGCESIIILNVEPGRNFITPKTFYLSFIPKTILSVIFYPLNCLSSYPLSLKPPT